jgi:imidazolonepropionase-like amidohydrolase
MSRIGLVVVLLTAPITLAQPPKPVPHAIRDARVVVSSDRTLPKSTVILRDGLIADVVEGDAKVPADAVVIDGKGLTVYAGFIDAGSPRGFDATFRRPAGGPPAPEDLAGDILAATKPDNRKGLTPEFEIRSALKADEEAITPWRRLGFTAHLAMPDGGYFSGQSALVSLSGATPRDAVLRPIVAQHAALKSFPGPDYPRALMGVIAHCRQALLDAGWHARRMQAFEAGKLTGPRPAFDPALDALNPMLAGKIPVVFDADSADEIHRALDFADEFRLKPLILGGKDAWKVKDRLKATDTPVILRLNFAEPGDREKQLPPRAREERERERKEEYACASELQKAGVRFAIATHSMTGDKPHEKFRENLRKTISAGLPAAAALKALTESAAEILGVSTQIGTVAKGKSAHLVVTDGDFDGEKTKVRYVFADGIKFEFDPDKKDESKKDEKKETAKKDDKKDDARVPTDHATELEAERIPKLQTHGRVLIRNATILTAAKPARLERADIFVDGGKIKAVGTNLPAPPGDVPIIDADGMFVMPGIIDTHAHFSISGGVNEFSLSVVPEVRVRDVINSEDVQIYRSLAGGVTTARLLHGSANVIGGQDAVIKLKYKKPATDLLVTTGPRGVKFALGENVKRTDGRFPNSRMGVEAVLVRAFSEAQAYRKQWDDYRANPDKLSEPRRDLRLEALVDILKGDLLVHCHCYRSDEILMLLRVADRFGFKVKSLQHVLEGYKVAPEIAAHGASCSLFSDWWAYKIEAFDAIPFAAALLHEAGASICLKSDSNELVRHLYQESAKLIKYGGMSEEDALKSITLNAAKQLGIDGRTGSIEPGKDADLAIFNGHPLNGFSRCEMTLVEGEVYFQHSDKLSPLAAAAAGPTKPSPAVTLPKPAADGAILLRNVTVHNPGEPAVISDVRIAKAKIDAIGREMAETGATVFDAKGLHLFPGLIDAGTQVGLTEIGSAKETHDFSEGGDFQPDLRAAVAVNPESELIPVTRANGVTTVVVRPIGSVIGGQAGLINLAGWVPKEMAVVEQLALHIEFPSESPVFRMDPSVAGMGRAVARKQREEKVKKLKELFAEAKRYDAGRKANPDGPIVPRLEAMLPYLHGDKPVIISAERKPEIVDALKLADDLKLKIILSGATDAWKVADELKKRDVPVIVGPVMSLPVEKDDPYDAPYANAAKLHKAGVRFCIRSTGSSNARNLPYEAAMAASYGLPPDEALKAITVYPAQILGVADQLGSIETGKRANLVLTNGDLLQPSTQVLGLFIDGKPLEPVSKQTRLYEKYRERLKEVQGGRAPLGTK